MVYPAGAVEEDLRSENEIVNPIDCSADLHTKADELAALSHSNAPRLQFIATATDKSVQARTEVNEKRVDRIRDKAVRPSVKRAKPWFDVEHIRDALRFRSCFGRLEEFPTLLRSLHAALRVVKIDLEKLTKPRTWGWRFAGADFRMADEQLVEYYATLPEVMEANDKICHAIYEKWRERDVGSPEFQDDLETSINAYEDAWQRALLRLKLNEPIAIAIWERWIRGSLGR